MIKVVRYAIWLEMDNDWIVDDSNEHVLSFAQRLNGETSKFINQGFCQHGLISLPKEVALSDRSNQALSSACSHEICLLCEIEHINIK